MITSAFTCTGPYAILIMMGVKKVENRSAMPVPAKGRCAVSCSKSFCKEEFGEFVRWAAANLPEVVSFDKPIPCRGNLGMWQLASALVARVTAADAQERLIGEVVATADDAARAFRGAVSIAGGNEGFFVLPLDVERRALATPILVSLGEPTTTTVDVGEVFSSALGAGAESFLVAHNHPSGNPKPSRDDVEMTRKLMAGAELLGVRLLDHLVIGSPECENGRGFASVFEMLEN